MSLYVVFVSFFLFLLFRRLFVSAAFRPRSPQFRGGALAPTASDVLRNGVQSPGKHTGGPARASAGPVGPDACGFARSLMGRANFGSQATQVFWRTVVHAGGFFSCILAGFSFLRVVSSLSEWTVECVESWECWRVAPWRAFRRTPVEVALFAPRGDNIPLGAMLGPSFGPCDSFVGAPPTFL